MRDLCRNQIKIYYSNYEKSTELIDEYGNSTGQYELTYSKPEMIMISVSASKGSTDNQPFGNLLDYDRVLITSNMNCNIDENTVLWIDKLDTEKTHDYIVKKVARSINQIQIAVKKVTVSEKDKLSS